MEAFTVPLQFPQKDCLIICLACMIVLKIDDDVAVAYAEKLHDCILLIKDGVMNSPVSMKNRI